MKANPSPDPSAMIQMHFYTSLIVLSRHIKTPAHNPQRQSYVAILARNFCAHSEGLRTHDCAVPKTLIWSRASYKSLYLFSTTHCLVDHQTDLQAQSSPLDRFNPTAIDSAFLPRPTQAHTSLKDETQLSGKSLQYCN